MSTPQLELHRLLTQNKWSSKLKKKAIDLSRAENIDPFLCLVEGGFSLFDHLCINECAIDYLLQNKRGLESRLNETLVRLMAHHQFDPNFRFSTLQKLAIKLTNYGAKIPLDLLAKILLEIACDESSKWQFTRKMDEVFENIGQNIPYLNEAIDYLIKHYLHSNKYSFNKLRRAVMTLIRFKANVPIDFFAKLLLEDASQSSFMSEYNAEVVQLVDGLIKPNKNNANDVITHLIKNYLFSKEYSFDEFQRTAIRLIGAGADVPIVFFVKLLLENKLENNQRKYAEEIHFVYEKIKSNSTYFDEAMRYLIKNHILQENTVSADMKRVILYLVKAGANEVYLAFLKAGITTDDHEKYSQAIEKEKIDNSNAYLNSALEVLISLYSKKEFLFADFKSRAMRLIDKGASPTGLLLIYFMLENPNNNCNKIEISKFLEKDPSLLFAKHSNNETVFQYYMNAYDNDFSFGTEGFNGLKGVKETIQLLPVSKELVAQQALNGNTILHFITHLPVDEATEELINKILALDKSTIDKKNNDGCTPVHYLLSFNRFAAKNLIEPLLSQTNIHEKNKYNHTLMHAACAMGNIDIMIYLFEKGLPITDVTSHNETLLHLAAERGDLKVVKWLLDKNVININAQANRYIKRGTALDVALEYRYIKIVLILLANGAELDTKKHKYEALSAFLSEKKIPHDIDPTTKRPVLKEVNTIFDNIAIPLSLDPKSKTPQMELKVCTVDLIHPNSQAAKCEVIQKLKTTKISFSSATSDKEVTSSLETEIPLNPIKSHNDNKEEKKPLDTIVIHIEESKRIIDCYNNLNQLTKAYVKYLGQAIEGKFKIVIDLSLSLSQEGVDNNTRLKNFYNTFNNNNLNKLEKDIKYYIKNIMVGILILATGVIPWMFCAWICSVIPKEEKPLLQKNPFCFWQTTTDIFTKKCKEQEIEFNKVSASPIN